VPRHGLAVAALVLGIVGIPFCFVLVPPALAVIFGLVATRAIKRSGTQHAIGAGFGMARAGWILGAIGLLLFGAFVATGASERFNERTAAVSDLEVGDCINLGEAPTVASVPVVDCDQGHDAEVIFTGELPVGPYPGESVVQNDIFDRCVPNLFQAYVGKDYASSMFEVQVLYPRQEGWSLDRGFLCLAVKLDGSRIVGTVHGSEA
jgi:hypothetical protein